MAAPRTVTALGRIDWNESEIRIMIAGESGETSEEIRRRARAVQRRAQGAAPVRTGELRASIHVNTTYPSDGAVADVTADAWHSLYVEFGRRAINLAGGRHYLNWVADSGREVFTQTAAPVGAVHFMRDALDEAGG